jgi:hypothetical protein
VTDPPDIRVVLRRREAGKSGNGRSEIDRLPFRVEAWRLLPIDPGKQLVDEADDALITVRFCLPLICLPLKGDQKGRHRDHKLLEGI